MFPGGCLPSLNEMSEQIKITLTWLFIPLTTLVPTTPKTLADWRTKSQIIGTP
ncbi:hypothetical protein ACOBV9_20980 (plasmid) [Pseudoalteromonas espejiana]